MATVGVKGLKLTVNAVDPMFWGHSVKARSLSVTHKL